MVVRGGQGNCVGEKLQRGSEHSNGSTVAFLSLCFGLMLPGGYRATFCAKQEENNTEMDQPNRMGWAQSAEDIKYHEYWKM